jgi:Lantibiotic dehydratase, N terminus
MAGWRPWPDVVVRGAGLPVADLLLLSDPDTAALAHEGGEPSARVRRSWLHGAERTSGRLLGLAADDRFRAALLWQNPRAIETVVDWLQRHERPYVRNQDRRRKEATLARYAQRYHARNETIGSFGPYSWATFDSEVKYAAVASGEKLIARRTVHFEDWAIDALAAALADAPEFRRRVPAAPLTGVFVVKTLVIRPDGPPCRLPSTDAAVLAALDGTRGAREIAADLRWRGTSGIRGEQDVLDALERLKEAGLIVWRPEVPQDAWPERSLRDQLSRLAPEALETLERLETGRRAVAAADGRPDRLSEAFALLDREMAELSGVPALRSKDQRRMGRRVVYEECERDVDVRLGSALEAELLPPISLLLTSARWLTWRFGICLEELIEGLYEQSAPASPGNGVSLGLLVSRFFERRLDRTWFAAAVEEFQDAWQDILRYETGVRRVKKTSSELADLVRTRFRSPPPTWYGAAYHSPDIMIAACGPDALRAGRFEFVLGELHLAMATIDSHTFAEFHPDPDRLLRTAEKGLARHPRVVPLYPRSNDFTGRDYPTPELYSDRYWYLSFGPANRPGGTVSGAFGPDRGTRRADHGTGRRGRTAQRPGRLRRTHPGVAGRPVPSPPATPPHSEDHDRPAGHRPRDMARARP